VEWYKVCGKAHEQTFAHAFRLSSLPNEWQRELAALWRLEADVNNGAYLQFLLNWHKEAYVYASQALRKIGAHKMAAIIDNCQALVDEHVNYQGKSWEDLHELVPQSVVARIYELSYQFMDYPDDVEQLGMKYYGPELKRAGYE
jgi:hypothetical protein